MAIDRGSESNVDCLSMYHLFITIGLIVICLKSDAGYATVTIITSKLEQE